MPLTRRDFIRASCCAAGAFGVATNFNRFGLMQALAQSAPPAYQALVCIFLFGGNDIERNLHIVLTVTRGNIEVLSVGIMAHRRWPGQFLTLA